MATVTSILKVVRWILTALLALGFLTSFREGTFAVITSAILTGFFLLALWLVPYWVAHERRRRTPEASAFREGFTPEVAHDNIALDTLTDLLWIRDPAGGERYLERSDIIGFKAAHDWNNGTFRQRIEIDVRDVHRPRWHVLFQRHSDTWIKTSKRNGAERDEWFARLRAWGDQEPNPAAQARAAGIDMSLPGLHKHYYDATTDEQRHNYLVAFDIGCLTAQIDQKTEWQRLGGTYPGPSEDLLKFKRA